MGKPKKGPREKDLTSRYFSGDLDEDRVDSSQRFSARNKSQVQDRMARTAQLRADAQSGSDLATLPIGQVIQVHSLFSDVQHEGKMYLCVLRKTMQRLIDTQLVVGDNVRFRQAELDVQQALKLVGRDGETQRKDMHTAVIEQILPRQTVLYRADSFKGLLQHPIVANAQQMLIVASIRMPNVKWGLVDRMLIAAQSGGLEPIVCLNKIDLASAADGGSTQMQEQIAASLQALTHYQSLGIRCLKTSVENDTGIEELRVILKDKETVLAGHSGVGKSSLINSVQPSLNLRIGEISQLNDKGRHTTTSARRYPLEGGGTVIDTPGVKLFGLWGVTAENLPEFFPDIENGSAPQWRKDSYNRIADSLL